MSNIEIAEALKMKNVIFVDVRSPKEYQESHIVGAINWPILDDLERETVGKIYKASGKDSAVQVGIESVQGKLKDFFEKTIALNSQYDAIVLYCARGGMRSDTLYSFGQSIGIKKLYKVIEGYKAYRNHVIKQSIEWLALDPLVVVHGRTGVGKTKILQGLENEGIPIIDLEELAKNAGSVFGNIPFDEKPPTQKMFENMVFEKLRTLKRPIFVESESRRIGTVSLTNEFFEAMIRGEHLLIETSIENRVEVISDLYKPAFKMKKINEAIEHLRKRLGHKKVDQLLEWIENDEYDKVIHSLIVDYYDPLYDYSIKRQKEFDQVIYYADIQEAIEALKKYYYEVINEKK